MKTNTPYKHGKKSGPPPKKGPQSQGLNLSYNTVKDVKLTEKNYNGRYRQSTSKRTKKRI